MGGTLGEPPVRFGLFMGWKLHRRGCTVTSVGARPVTFSVQGPHSELGGEVHVAQAAWPPTGSPPAAAVSSAWQSTGPGPP
jgi:hypothetical protein